MSPKILNKFQKGAMALAIASASFELHAFTLEEMVVTAQHREESLQDVPIAITAIGAEDIRTADISDINAISLRTPGFSMGNFLPAQPQLFIRGVGSNADGAAEDQSVVLFLDGVYLGRTAGQAFDLFDLERLEILRGPQGTLYGKNAAGGAINIVSQKPTEELEAALEVSTGSMGYWGTRGKVSGALSDTVAGKISFNYKERDGYVESLVANIDDLNAFESKGVRGQLLITPTDSLEVLISADYSEDSRNSPGRNTGEELFLADFVAMSGLNPDFHENLQSEKPHSDIESSGVSVQVNWDTDQGTFTSITAYREAKSDTRDVAFSADIEYFPLASLSNSSTEKSEQFSQEFRFAADAGDNLFWQAGVYYLNEDVKRIEANDIACGFLCNGFNPNPYNPADPSTSPLFLPQASTQQANETNSYGIFAQGTWTFNENWDLTLGARYTYETKDASNIGTPDGAFSILEAYDVEMDESWSAFTPKAALNYRLDEDTTLYSTVSTGFKSGGYQGMAPTEAAASTAFDEESVINYEIGIKGTALDSTLRYGATAFHTEYDDLQVLVQTIQNGGPGPQLTQNAGSARSRGFEFDAQWQLHEYWQVSGTYAFLDTEYRELEGNLQAFEGNALRNAPEEAVSLSVIFDYPLANGRLNARADFTYKDEAYQDVENQEAAKMDSYNVTNLRVAYAPESDRWELAGWVKNATDEEYMLHNSTLNPGLAQVTVPAAPRTLGLTFTINY
jgi:iron complex outermembrane recepter protein